ncbi:MAG: glutathione S-transferase family protein [Woeseiaceae bacterium]
MLELYHGEPAANSLKSLLCLKEKGLDFVSHRLNLGEFEQHEPAYVAINPHGQVPTLVHDGNVITESTLINEYLEDVYPEPRLRPEDPVARAHMRYWTKFVDEYFCPALSVLGWQAIIKGMVEHLSEQEFEAKIARIPLQEQRDKWRIAAKQAFPKDQLDDCSRRVDVSVARIEAALEKSPWVAGPDYTLADIACFAMMAGMPVFQPKIMNRENAPRCMDWHARMLGRPAVKATLAIP